MLIELFSSPSAYISTVTSFLGEKKSPMLNSYCMSVPASSDLNTLSPFIFRTQWGQSHTHSSHEELVAGGRGSPAIQWQSRDLKAGSAWLPSLPFCEQAYWGGNFIFLEILHSDTFPGAYISLIFLACSHQLRQLHLWCLFFRVSQSWVCHTGRSPPPGLLQPPVSSMSYPAPLPHLWLWRTAVSRCRYSRYWVSW